MALGVVYNDSVNTLTVLSQNTCCPSDELLTFCTSFRLHFVEQFAIRLKEASECELRIHFQLS